MPSLQKFHANVARHIKLMDKNLCANLIRHENIITTRAKAKRAQSKIEKFLADAIRNNKELADKDFEYRLENNDALNFLQPPDRKEVGSKIINELAQRYPGRSSGFTRIIKLEPRLGEDKAPMSVLELVDSDYEIKFWYTAKIVARLELQNIPVDDLTKHNVHKLTKLRNDGEESFRNAVETAKLEFFKFNPETGSFNDPEIEKNLQNKPNMAYHEGPLVGTLLKSKKFGTTPRPTRETVEIPKSPFLS
ncbi:ribosomal protein L17 [Suhomyces tanzawaensis NRRL Y-17324]|uniref:Ribosomal protein L17 n=1 Tax=Suhomyces tanzawaensis NRRL Y-17324 TaxID=984487 RepID=A0A1E4SL65_9ASCO|nr:ribosomal protein L17 [Suhomyces tanzawaensis NRRL Y-17324]ODV80246.1 ribosomal protein L17 [Suhomyces tanzawaensis NRRL Y-17324]